MSSKLHRCFTAWKLLQLLLFSSTLTTDSYVDTVFTHRASLLCVATLADHYSVNVMAAMFMQTV